MRARAQRTKLLADGAATKNMLGDGYQRCLPVDDIQLALIYGNFTLLLWYEQHHYESIL